jgi:hypothetical protein
MSIQQDVLDTIGTGGIPVDSLLGAMGNIGANELQITVNALSRARRIQVIEGRYQIVPAKRPVGNMPPSGRPPNAEAEAAASLLPVTQVCVTCGGLPQALHQFRFVGPGNVRSPECNMCHGKKTRAGLSKKRGQFAISILQYESPRERGDNRDVSTESHQHAAAVPETSGSHSHSDPREDARTPASTDVTSPSIGIQFHSAQREDSHCDIAQSVERRPVKADVPGSSPGVAATLPVSTSDVMEHVKALRQANLNKITLLRVEIENLESEVADQERFLELYERFAGGA